MTANLNAVLSTRVPAERAVAAVRRIAVRAPLPPELRGERMIIARVFFSSADAPLDAKDMRAMLTRTAARMNWAARGEVAEQPPLLLAAQN